MEIKFFVFSLETFLEVKFHESEVKHEHRNVKRDLTVTIEVKNS